jgi:hypothetical protein
MAILPAEHAACHPILADFRFALLIIPNCSLKHILSSGKTKQQAAFTA